MKEKRPDQTEPMKEKKTTEYDLDRSPAETFREPEAAYLTENEIHDKSIAENKTLSDYMALPEGARIEMIDGKFYEMSAPTSLHTLLGIELCSAFKNYVKQNGGNCIPFVAPTDVQLDKYQKAGVREYWMIFPEENVIEVCSFEKNTVKTYSFEDQIPVGIWSGQCEINFPEIYESLRFLLERQV